MKAKKGLHSTHFQPYIRKKKNRKTHRSSLQMRLLRNFLTKGISAAGISHIASAKSPLLRAFWFLSTSLAVTMMVLMIFRTLQEYWKYPKASQTKTFTVKSLEFPAVTVCSRYLLPRMNSKEANLQAMDNLYPFLMGFPIKEAPAEQIEACFDDPLCRWNEYVAHCECDRNPCDTPLCHPAKQQSDTCDCSKTLCSQGGLHHPDACQKVVRDGYEYCVCNRDFVHPNYNLSDYLPPLPLNESYFLNVSQEILKIVQLARLSNYTDLRDVESQWIPEVRVLDDYGISFDNLFISCVFEEEPCDTKDFTTFYHPNLGKCYMFNFVGYGSKNEGKPKVTLHPEKRNGLQIYLQNPKHNMMPFLAITLGVRLVIHDPYSLPLTKEVGMDLRTGDMHSMPMEYMEVNRLGPPWGLCARDGDSSTSSYLKKPYNQVGCERQCLNALIFNQCQCYSRNFMLGTTIPIGLRVCRPDQRTCVRKALEALFYKKFKCNCPPTCRVKKYKVMLSSGKLNKQFFRFLKKAKSLKMVNGTPHVLEPDFKPSLMGVSVFYKSMTVRNISETSMYSWEFLVANIGGNMGLFLGLSLITFVEIAEFLIDFFIKTIQLKRS